MGTACGWKKRVIQTNITYAKQTVTRTFSVSPQSHSPFSALVKTFCLTFRAYLNTQKYRLYNKKSYWDGIKEGRVQKEDFNFLFKLFHVLYMKNYKNGFPPPLEKANLSGGWRLLGKGVTRKNICKKNGGGGVFVFKTPKLIEVLNLIHVSTSAKQLGLITWRHSHLFTFGLLMKGVRFYCL